MFSSEKWNGEAIWQRKNFDGTFSRFGRVRSLMDGQMDGRNCYISGWVHVSIRKEILLTLFLI